MGENVRGENVFNDYVWNATIILYATLYLFDELVDASWGLESRKFN